MCTLYYIIHVHNKAQFHISPLITAHPDSIPKQTDLAITSHRDIGLTYKYISYFPHQDAVNNITMY